MRLGINTVLWFWPFDSKRISILRKIKDIGFQTVEFALSDRAPENIKKIAGELEEVGLDCVIDGVVGGDKDILSPEGEIREAGLEYLLETVKLCAELGSRYLIGPLYSTGIKDYLFDEGQRQRSFNQAVFFIRKIADYAAEKDVKIAIEPLNRYETNFINTTAGLKSLIDAIDKDNVGFQIDTFHANIEEKSIYDAIKLAGKKLFHMHVPESDRGTPGSGLVDWEALKTGLSEVGYSHNLDMEIAHPHVENIRIPGAIWRTYDHSPDKMAKMGFDFLKKLLG